MVRYSKEYGDIGNNIFTWGLEAALGFLFKKANKFVSKFDSEKSFYAEMNAMSGNRLTHHQVSKTIHRLKRSGYIEIDDTSGRSIRLTDKAKMKIVEQIAQKTLADHRHRFVSFDIPEPLHKNRDQFRRMIKRMGFRQIQQSLWVIDKNVGNMVEIAARENDVEEYIAYIISEKSNIESHIEKVLKVT
ncbi:MAG TPA: hypothetical protein VJK08_00960 [Patescibacteria group bacterium]|nr:hypothetical protein [Patescibacteria group bacterium]